MRHFQKASLLCFLSNLSKVYRQYTSLAHAIETSNVKIFSWIKVMTSKLPILALQHLSKENMRRTQKNQANFSAIWAHQVKLLQRFWSWKRAKAIPVSSWTFSMLESYFFAWSFKKCHLVRRPILMSTTSGSSATMPNNSGRVISSRVPKWWSYPKTAEK